MTDKCFACEKVIPEIRFSSVDVTLKIGTSSETASIPYCEACMKKIRNLDRDILLDGIEQHIEYQIAGIPKTRVPISEKEVRVIAENLGASEKVIEALVERCFGKEWTGKIPQGARMNEYQNRDRLVAFVAMKLQDLWHFEA